MPDNPPADLCPNCRHPHHLPGTECQTHVNHGPNRFHLCLCLARLGAALPCPPQMTCQGGTLGYADVWYLQQGHSLSSDDGVISPEVLKTGPVAVGFPSTETDAVAADLEGIRRALAAVATDRPTPEQIAEWNTADKEMAQRVRAALPGVPLHHAYAVLRARRTLQRMDAAAVVPAVPGRGDDGLRDRIAAAIRSAACTGDCGVSEEECVSKRIQATVWHRGVLAEVIGTPEAFADALLAVLPPPADRAAELASLAVNSGRALRDEKRHYEIACQENARLRATIERVRRLHDALDAETDLTSPDDEITRGGAARKIAAALDGWTDPGELRRLAAEAQQPTPVAASEPRANETGRTVAEAQQQPDTKPPAEDPARIDRLRPEFTDHASIESIDAQLRRARAQERRWHIRTEWLISLRQARAEQKARGEWPAAVEQPAAADTGEETEA